MKLKIADNFEFPQDVVTSTLVVYGGKGMGKTNFGAVLAEELSRVGLRWSVLDPMGVWWGLRHSADGKGSGVECLILGGVHADIPIEPTGGAVVADLVADEDANVIIDFSRKANGQTWGIGEKIRFVTEYGKRLFERQGEINNGKRRQPVMQIIDESARFIPQVIPHGNPDLSKCLSVWEQITEEGRNFGLGICFLTQRSARMAKSVSELADAMLSFRIFGPRSLDAIMDWVGDHVAKDHIKTISETVRSLDRGSCLVISPGWLKYEGIAKIRARTTFDSSATPKPGEQAKRITGKAAKPDLAKYAARMAETIERAKADDPRELKKRITELQKEIATKPAAKPTSPSGNDAKAIDRAIAPFKKALGDAMKIIAQINAIGFDKSGVTKEEVAKALEAATAQIVKLAESKLNQRNTELDRLKKEAERLLAKLAAMVDGENVDVTVTVRHNEPFTVSQGIERASRPPVAQAPVPDGLGRTQANVLNCLAELLQCTGKESVRKEQLAAWCEYSPTSGGYNNLLGSLRSQGFIDYPQPGHVTLTDAGRSIARPGEIPTDNREMLERAKRVLGGSEGRILEVAHRVHPQMISKSKLAEALGFSETSGGFNNYLGHMRTLGFIDYPQKGHVKVSDWMFIS